MNPYRPTPKLAAREPVWRRLVLVASFLPLVVGDVMLVVEFHWPLVFSIMMTFGWAWFGTCIGHFSPARTLRGRVVSGAWWPVLLVWALAIVSVRGLRAAWFWLRYGSES